MKNPKDDEIRQVVRKTYGDIAKAGSTGCGCAPSSCCGTGANLTSEDIATGLGYSSDDMAAIPEGANMGLGCGNPQAIASLQLGETVLDLGSGGGFDCFLAAKAVGESGRVIGIDMTPEMVSKGRANAAKAEPGNVEFRLGEIENLPVADNEVDIIISNCVINLSPDKAKVYNEAFRVLKPGGRLAIFDIVATAELPAEMKEDLALLTGCVAGAAQVQEVESMLAEAGFTDIRISPKEDSAELIRKWAPGRGIENYIASASIEAIKPLDSGG
ncbi:MAG: arsenite methyltransferase [Armatimonadetes bacterium]|nr:arsenite methyltransferase [Armatimonadota bacterium]NIM24391.1 arsenite methyltransferase [Armatimonadota bacterium]NIM68260.1 arsenite methyltransferase [Armatimonadota bacterium]NIM75161.1 arsenite methyltransferase [Armatimonadota bacterium]NIN06465.1 arsenite methyltransferase [Armatimonadota bacterium]